MKNTRCINYAFDANMFHDDYSDAFRQIYIYIMLNILKLSSRESLDSASLSPCVLSDHSSSSRIYATYIKLFIELK